MATAEADKDQMAKEAVEEHLGRLLSAEDILNADDIQYRTINVPEWKGAVRLRTLSADEVSDYLEAIGGTQKRDAMALMVMRSAVKGDGTQLFTKPEQLEKLKKRSMSAFVRLQDVILELNGLNKAADAARKNA